MKSHFANRSNVMSEYRKFIKFMLRYFREVKHDDRFIILVVTLYCAALIFEVNIRLLSKVQR